MIIKDWTWQGSQPLVEACVWQILYNNLFSPDCTDKRSNEDWPSFGAFQRSLQASVADESNPFNYAFHVARTLGARMAILRHGPHSDPDRLATILLKEVTPLINLRDHPENQVIFSDSESISEDDSEPEIDPKTGSPIRRYDLAECLSTLARQAVNLDFFMLAAGKRIKIEMQDPQTGDGSGFPFREDCMRALHGQRPPNQSLHGIPVDLVIRPLLRSYGEMDPVYYTDLRFVEFHNLGIGSYHKCSESSKMRILVDHACKHVGELTEFDINKATPVTQLLVKGLQRRREEEERRRQGKSPSPSQL